MSSETTPPAAGAERAAARLDEPSPDGPAEPERGRAEGATAAERAAAQAVADLSGPERLDGSHGPTGAAS